MGLSDKWFVLVDSVLLTGLGRVMMMPSLVLAARICPEARPAHALFARTVGRACAPLLQSEGLACWRDEGTAGHCMRDHGDRAQVVVVWLLKRAVPECM